MGKKFGLLGSYVVVKGIISSFLVVFGYLETSKGISWGFNMLASISEMGYFYSSNVFFSSSLKCFCFTFSSPAVVQTRLVRENVVFIKQCHGWFSHHQTYCFDLLEISMQISVPLLFIIISKNGSLVWLFSIVDWIFLLIWCNIESKWSGFIKLTVGDIWVSFKFERNTCVNVIQYLIQA